LETMKTFFTTIACIMLMMGCSGKKSLVVLMPDPDGNVGRISVSNSQGRQDLSEAYTATEIKEKHAPGSIKAMSEKEIQDIFKDALKATPEAPLSFILYFVTGTTSLNEASQVQLKQAQEEVKKRVPCNVFITGHTDTMGKQEVNAELSLERAQIVRDELIKIGVDPVLIHVFAHGENDPLIPTADEVDEPKNRRVEVFIR